jgi:hypothetical protein
MLGTSIDRKIGARMTRTLLHSIALALTLGVSAAAASAPLTTVAERSGYQETGRYEEVIALCSAFQRAYPKAVRCVEFGRTPEGRPMLALIASRSGAHGAKAARQRNLPVVLVQGGIHAGEIDGKDAGFLALREALDGTAAQGALEKLVLVFVPVFNIDGHERFGALNRPNQRGPKEMGWRTTAQNFNLNRDYAKADSPEMQAMLRLVNEWDPLATIDLHVTDGAKFEHDISIQVEPGHSGDVALRQVGRRLRDAVIADLAAQGSLPVPFYMQFAVDGDPSSGFEDGAPNPRFSTGYFQLRNRFGMLVETHSWKDYPTRVRITRNAVVSVLSQFAAHGAEWRLAAQEADSRSAQMAGQPVALTFKVSDTSRMIDFRGYEYSRTPSDVSGTLMTRYDDTKPQLWRVPLRDDVQPDLSVTAPGAGYVVPAASAAWVGEKLRQHGIDFRTLRSPLTRADVKLFRAEKTTFATTSNEGRQPLTLTGSWRHEQRDVTAGALFVPIAQAKARLVMALLEPQAPDSFAAWGAFNNSFERKEYMEDYVAEDVARAMLSADPALAAAFQKKLAEDADFAKSSSARLEFFYRLHPSWDERFNLYPVLQVDEAPPR